MRSLRVGVALTCALIVSATPAAPARQGEAPIALPLTMGAPGDSFSYRYAMRTTIEQSMGERALQPQSAAYRLTLGFTVRQTDATGTSEMVLRVRPASVVVNDGSGDQVKRLEMTIPSPPPSPEADPVRLAQHALEHAIDRANITFTLSSSGDVSNVQGFESIIEAFGAIEGADARLLGPLAPGQIETMLESIFACEGAAGSSRRVGAGWQNARSIDVPPVAVLDLTDQVRLDSAADGIATLQSKGDLGVRRPTTEDPARPALTVEGYTSTATTRWDFNAGRLVGRSAEMSMTSTWALAEVNLRQVQTTTVQIDRL